MANKTIGGNNNLNDINLNHLKAQTDKPSLAIWDYDESVNHTRRVSPKNLIDAVMDTTIQSLQADLKQVKRSLGGDDEYPEQDPYGYSSVYEKFNSLKGSTAPTNVYNELQQIEYIGSFEDLFK